LLVHLWLSQPRSQHFCFTGASTRGTLEIRHTFLFEGALTEFFYPLQREFFRSKHLANFSLALPLGPVLSVKFHEAYGPFDGLCFGFQLKDRVSAYNFLGFGERPIRRG
jgi:hypothetical protein